MSLSKAWFVCTAAELLNWSETWDGVAGLVNLADVSRKLLLDRDDRDHRVAWSMRSASRKKSIHIALSETINRVKTCKSTVFCPTRHNTIWSL